MNVIHIQSSLSFPETIAALQEKMGPVEATSPHFEAPCLVAITTNRFHRAQIAGLMAAVPEIVVLPDMTNPAPLTANVLAALQKNFPFASPEKATSAATPASTTMADAMRAIYDSLDGPRPLFNPDLF